jgi:hypothetical protein
MNSFIVKLVFNEFCATLVEKFKIDATSEELYTIWREKVNSMKITVAFNNGSVVNIPTKEAENESDETNVEVVKPKKAAKPAEKTGGSTCPYKSVRGDNKGQVCGKNTTKDCIMCSAHKKHSDKYVKVCSDSEDDAPAAVAPQVAKKTCDYKLSRGDRNGEICGASCVAGTEFCSKHSDKKEKKSEALPKAKGAEPSADKAPAKITAAKDASGRFVIKGDRNLVIKSRNEMLIIGKVVNDKTVSLSEEDIEFCKKNRLRYEESLSKKNIEDVIDEITGGAADEEEEDVDHQDEIMEDEEEGEELLEEDE